MQKKALLFYLVISLVCAPAGVANAAAFSGTDVEAGAKERVYAEVLSGEITNEADVLEQHQLSIRKELEEKDCQHLKSIKQ